MKSEAERTMEEGAVKILQESQPRLLKVVKVLLNEGETPARIEKAVKRMGTPATITDLVRMAAEALRAAQGKESEG